MLVVLACVVLLAVRYVVLPRIESYAPEIAERVTLAIGAPVAIESLTTGWDGWNPKIVVTGIAVHDRTGGLERPLLELPRVEATVSWWSLPLLDLRLKQLEIDGPRLAISRDIGGRLHIAGLEIDPQSTVDDTRLTDWILRQRQIIVRNALILWTDELRRAPQLVLDRVDVRLEHPLGSRRHRIGLTGVPPSEIASPIDLRGEFTDLAEHDFSKMRARMYLRLDFADIAAWSEWIPLPVDVGRRPRRGADVGGARRGQGARHDRRRRARRREHASRVAATPRARQRARARDLAERPGDAQVHGRRPRARRAQRCRARADRRRVTRRSWARTEPFEAGGRVRT